jgi:hypothetical protein
MLEDYYVKPSTIDRIRVSRLAPQLVSPYVSRRPEIKPGWHGWTAA